MEENKKTVTCHQCQAQIFVTNPRIFVFNNPELCIISLISEHATCSCGKVFSPFIPPDIKMEIEWREVPLELQKGRKKIVVPASKKLSLN